MDLDAWVFLAGLHRCVGGARSQVESLGGVLLACLLGFLEVLGFGGWCHSPSRLRGVRAGDCFKPLGVTSGLVGPAVQTAVSLSSLTVEGGGLRVEGELLEVGLLTSGSNRPWQMSPPTQQEPLVGLARESRRFDHGVSS